MADSAAEALDKVLRIPDTYRIFSVLEASVSRRYGVSADLLVELLDLGLPNVHSSSNRVFDARDLDNIGIGMQLMSPRWLALQRWANAFSGTVAMTTNKVIGIYAECNESHSGEPCRFTIDAALRDNPHVAHIVEQNDEFLISLQIPPVNTPLSRSVSPIVHRAGELTFYLLCNELASDVGFARDTGLADCRLASMELSRTGHEAGIRTRPASGLFAATPFPSRHAWIQVESGTEWISLDPFLLSTMARWRIIDPSEWPPSRPPSALFLRLHQSFKPLIYDCGAAANEHFWTVR